MENLSNYMTSYFFTLILSFLVLLAPIKTQAAPSSSDVESQLAEIKRVSDAQAKNLATALSQVQEVVTDFQGLNGRVDQSLHENEDQNKIIQDNQKRLDVLEDKMNQIFKQLEEIKTAGLLKPAQASTLKEFGEYQKGLSQINAEDFKGAVQSLQQFLTSYPKSPLFENAQYWIGQSYYSMKDYPTAVNEFQKVIQKFPTGEKAAASLLKQGYAFFEMQSFDDSKAFLSKIVTKYPTSLEAVAARDKIRKIDELLAIKAREAEEQKSVK